MWLHHDAVTYIAPTGRTSCRRQASLDILIRQQHPPTRADSRVRRPSGVQQRRPSTDPCCSRRVPSRRGGVGGTEFRRCPHVFNDRQQARASEWVHHFEGPAASPLRQNLATEHPPDGQLRSASASVIRRHHPRRVSRRRRYKRVVRTQRAPAHTLRAMRLPGLISTRIRRAPGC